MTIRISVRQFVGEMDTIGDEWEVYLNRRTGKFRGVTSDELRAAEEFEEEEHVDVDAEIREIFGSNDWLPLPSKFDIHEYAIVREFCESVENDMLRGDLLDAIRGSGAFGRFKSMADRHGLIDDWYKYRDEAFAKIARDWLDEHGIAFEP